LWISELWIATMRTSTIASGGFFCWCTIRRMPPLAPLPPTLEQTLSGLQTRRLRWLLAVPKLGIVLLLAALFSLLWLLHYNEIEEERSALIKDVLWLEQNLRFHFDSAEEQLQQLASEIASGHARETQFRVRATHLLKTMPEVSHLFWLDQQQRLVAAEPTANLPDEELSPLGPTATSRGIDTARRFGKPVYGDFFRSSNQQALNELLVPIHSQGQTHGTLIAVFNLEQLLAGQVPWWFTEKYKVDIIDTDDNVLAVKTRIEDTGGQSYEIPLEPPGHGLKLRVTGYRSQENSLQRLLVVAIIVLAIGVFWSLWLVRELMQKRSLAEEALRAEHAFRTSMEDSLTVGMRACDLEGKVIYVNPAFCKMTGFSREELVGQVPPMPYWVPEQIDETFAMHQAVLAGKAPPDGFEMTFRRKDEERFHALVYEAKLIDGHGQHIGWMASVLDITERKHAEDLARQQQEQLQFTARLVTMGEMASTLAHELNQPLAAIASYNSGCLNLLANDNANPSELKPALEKIGLQAQRAGKIIRRVHDFVRKSEPRRAPCDLSEVVEDCLGFIEPEARKRHIRLACQQDSPLPLIPADRLMLEQVLLNLLRNGMEAMNDTVDAHRRLEIAVRLGSNEVSVSVSDQGCGIASDIRDKLFTAFFTTKAEGMGIGLSICRSIVEFHRGRLWAEDNPHSPTGTGTIFTFSLPLTAD